MGAWLDVLKWLGTLVGGALIGGLIAMGFERFKNRPPAVRYSVDSDPFFSTVPGLSATVHVVEDDKPYDFSELSLVGLSVTNASSKDFTEFGFKLAIPDGCSCVSAVCDKVDESHAITIVKAPTPAAPVSVLEFRCEPFNRRDRYAVTLYVAGNYRAMRHIKPTTKVPVRFVETEQIVEVTPSPLRYSAVVATVLAMRSDGGTDTRGVGVVPG